MAVVAAVVASWSAARNPVASGVSAAALAGGWSLLVVPVHDPGTTGPRAVRSAHVRICRPGRGRSRSLLPGQQGVRPPRHLLRGHGRRGLRR